MPESRASWLPAVRRTVFGLYRDEGGRKWVEASGDSMRPLIRPGTLMLVEFGARPEGPGDIVLFPVGDTIVSHRVVGYRFRGGRPLLLTKGDAHAYFDPPVDPADVLGVVRALRRAPAGAPTQAGCADRHARAIARASLWGGRIAARLRRVALRLPDSLRGTALRGVSLVVGIATLAASTAAIRVARTAPGVRERR